MLSSLTADQAFMMKTVHAWYNEVSRTKNSSYFIISSNFTNNVASQAIHDKFYINNLDKFQGFGRGGGLQLILKGNASGNNIILQDCLFQNNSAVWGGGLKVSMQDASINNSLTILKSIFKQNSCLRNGGGGVNIGYTFYQPSFPSHNKIMFSDCEFMGNEANFGGGLAFYSSDSTSSELNNLIEFKRCTWKANKAYYGSAISMSVHAWTTYLRGNLPTPKFTNASFINNAIIKHTMAYSKKNVYEVYANGTGAFFATRYTIIIQDLLEFISNNGSAMYLTSTVMKIAPNTTVNFTNNNGFNGGAIALIAFSVIVIGDNVSVTFKDNRAVRCGGAIYSFSIDKHDYLSSRSCFLQNDQPLGVDYNNISITFLNNAVGDNSSQSCGHLIYVTTLKPCMYYCKQHTNDFQREQLFSCVGNITFSSTGELKEYQISTAGAKFEYDMNKTNFSMIPNKETFLPVSMVDDLNQSVKGEYHLTVINDKNSNIKADEAYTYLSENRTELYGKPKDSGHLLLSTTGLRGFSIGFRLHMEECPPGYVLFNDAQFKLNLLICKCSAGTKQYYRGIEQCNDENFTASIQHGYWIGYVDGETENHLYYGYCPSRYCFQREERHRQHLLIEYASQKDLDWRVCGESRTGILCGKCRDGYSAFYHGDSAFCYKDSDSKCELGWLFYFVSELVPLAIMFTVIIVLNTNFASGELNGFIFFAQIFDLLSITGYGFIWFPRPAFIALKLIRSIYKFLNFDFFNANKISFCLWKGATALDMIIFKFVTVICALLLIIITIWLMNKCNIYKRLSCLRVNTVKTSITHGISTFLVMVYAQCAKISFNVLDFTIIYGKGDIQERVVVTYQGTVTYFCSRHLLYAIPAIVSLLVMTIGPIFILTLYPSCFKVITYFKLEESRCISSLTRRLPHAYLKPFTDSFQSCFKDNMRFFAGLYFTYRVAVLIGWFAPSHLSQSFMLLELIFVTILLIHAIAQPYYSRTHNILDALLFFNLAVINGITLYNFHYAKYYKYYQQHNEVLIYIQLILVYTPLAYIIVYAVYCVTRKVKTLYKTKANQTAIHLMDLMDSDLDDDREGGNEGDREPLDYENEVDYKLFRGDESLQTY